MRVDDALEIAERTEMLLTKEKIMRNADSENWECRAGDHAETDLKEVIMGLRWDPLERGKTTDERHVDVDAFCMLFDEQRRAVDFVHPGHVRNANGSVIHTGDSITGAGAWDDERIIAFLHALPETVSALMFAVACASGRPFGEVSNASCHVTDHLTEQELLRVDLTEFGQATAHCVATLSRTSAGWKIQPGAGNKLFAEALAELLPKVGAKFVERGSSSTG